MPSHEFELIEKYFAPLAEKAEGAFGLADDAAALPAGDYIVTKDMMIAGVHFLPTDPLDLVGRKLIRVNLSDLAAKGSKPAGYFLAAAWPKNAKADDIALFARGLAADQETFRVSLFGGDTTRHREKAAPLTLCATFFGAAPRQGMVHRDGAAAGDDLYVTGTIGDAGLGLAALEKREKFAAAEREYLVGRYRLPDPRMTFGGALPGLASAALDISDGLLADAGHLAFRSGVAAVVEAPAIPLSGPAAHWLGGQPDKRAAYGMLAAFGDDYEILFAAPPSRRRAVEMAAKVSKTQVTRIGAVSKGAGVVLKDGDGAEIRRRASGFDHFQDMIA